MNIDNTNPPIKAPKPGWETIETYDNGYDKLRFTIKVANFEEAAKVAMEIAKSIDLYDHDDPVKNAEINMRDWEVVVIIVVPTNTWGSQGEQELTDSLNIELLDVVDRQDNVLGTTDRETAHTSGVLHRVAAVFVFNQEGELYVQQHPRDGKWDHSVGGHVSKGETYATAASREAHEELGITQPLEELATGLMGEEYTDQQHLFGLYSCIADPKWEFIPNDEVKVIFPMSIASIRQAMIDEPEERFTRGFRITMAEYVRQKGL